nr:transcription factor bHLH167-like [Ipomoea batatas]
MCFKQQETVRALMIARPLLITTETEALLDFLLAHSWGNMFNRVVARISVWNSVCCASTSCAKANAAVSDDGLARITSLRISGFSPAINIEINTGAGTLVTLFNSFSYALRYAPTVRWMLPKVVLKDSGYHLRWQHGGFEWCLKLTWLEKSPASDLLGEATNFIKQLEENVNELKARKDSLQLPVLIIGVNESERGESLEINIVCGSEHKKLKMHKVFCILKEEGAEVVSAYNSTVGLKIYHTILCKAFSPRLGMDTNRVQQRLKNFISSI